MSEKSGMHLIVHRVMQVSMVIGVLLLIDRVLFFRSAERMNATALQITAKNGFCNSKDQASRAHKSSYRCTKFTALIEYEVNGLKHMLKVKAGTARSPNVSTSHARFQVGSPVPIVYNAKKPADAFFDDSYEIWKPVILWLVFAAMLISGMRFFSNLKPKEK